MEGLWVHSQLSRKISERLPGTEREMKVGPLGLSHLNCQMHSPSLSSPGLRQGAGQARAPTGACVCGCIHAACTHVGGQGWMGGNLRVDCIFQACPLSPTSGPQPEGGTGLGFMGSWWGLLGYVRGHLTWHPGGAPAHLHVGGFLPAMI